MRQWTFTEYILRLFARLGGVFLTKLYWRITKTKRPRARAIILNKDKTKILLVKNITDREFCLPGGGIEHGENSEKAVLREVYEELQIPITILYKLGTYIHQKRDTTVEIFVTQSLSEDFFMEWELDDAKWFSLTNLPPNIKKAIKHVLRDFFAHNEPVTGIWG